MYSHCTCFSSDWVLFRAVSYGREQSVGSCEAGSRWQLKGQLRLSRVRVWLHCCSALEQTDWHGSRTPLWALQWGTNTPHTSRRKDWKQPNSISTCSHITQMTNGFGGVAQTHCFHSHPVFVQNRSSFSLVRNRQPDVWKGREIIAQTSAHFNLDGLTRWSWGKRQKIRMWDALVTTKKQQQLKSYFWAWQIL